MVVSTAVALMQEALFVSLWIPAPLLAGILIIGLTITVFQAATQIHEMTLVFVPKMIVTYFLLFVLGNWMLFTLVNFAHRMFASIPTMIR